MVDAQSKAYRCHKRNKSRLSEPNQVPVDGKPVSQACANLASRKQRKSVVAMATNRNIFEKLYVCPISLGSDLTALVVAELSNGELICLAKRQTSTTLYFCHETFFFWAGTRNVVTYKKGELSTGELICSAKRQTSLKL